MTPRTDRRRQSQPDKERMGTPGLMDTGGLISRKEETSWVFIEMKSPGSLM